MELAEVVRDRLPGEVEVVGDRARSELSVGEQLEHVTPVVVGQCPEHSSHKGDTTRSAIIDLRK